MQMGYCTGISSKQMRRVLERVTGSHHLFQHPYRPNTVPVPHPKKDLPRGTVRAIRKLAGLL